MAENNKTIRNKLKCQISALIIGILILPMIAIVLLIYQNMNYSNILNKSIGKDIQQTAEWFASSIERDINNYADIFKGWSPHNNSNTYKLSQESFVEEVFILNTASDIYSSSNSPLTLWLLNNELLTFETGVNFIYTPQGGKMIFKQPLDRPGIYTIVVLGKGYWQQLVSKEKNAKVCIFNESGQMVFTNPTPDTYLINDRLFDTEQFRTFLYDIAWGKKGYSYYDIYGKYGKQLVVGYAPIRNKSTSSLLGTVMVLLETSKVMPDERISKIILFISIFIGGTILVRLIFKLSEIIIAQFIKISKKFEIASEETEAMRKKLLLAEKLASLGRISSGLAHEIGNPLSSILSISQILLSRNLTEEKRNEFLAKINKEALRIDRLIKEFLYFSKHEKSNFTEVDVNQVIEGAIKAIPENRKQGNIQVYKNLSPNLPYILGDKNKLEIAFANIILNSFQALNENGTIYIKTYKQKAFISVSIKDTGSGIPKEEIEKIFDPFYTTKQVGQGFGLGLFICQQIIEAHQGIIKVTSETGNGTEFIVQLPFADTKGGTGNDT